MKYEDIVFSLRKLILTWSYKLSNGFKSYDKEYSDFYQDICLHIYNIWKNKNGSLEEKTELAYYAKIIANYGKNTYIRKKPKELNKILTEHIENFEDDKNIVFCAKFYTDDNNENNKWIVTKIIRKLKKGLKVNYYNVALRLLRLLLKPSSMFRDLIKEGFSIVNSASKILEIPEKKLIRIIGQSRVAMKGEKLSTKMTQRLLKLCKDSEKEIRTEELIMPEEEKNILTFIKRMIIEGLEASDAPTGLEEKKVEQLFSEVYDYAELLSFKEIKRSEVPEKLMELVELALKYYIFDEDIEVKIEDDSVGDIIIKIDENSVSDEESKKYTAENLKKYLEEIENEE